MKSNHWIPEIFYEDSEDGLTSKIPFINVPVDEEMPTLLYMFESRETGEIEPGPEGEELPVVEMTLHQFVDMEALKRKLSADEYDNVRFALGLESLAAASKKGSSITDQIRKNISVD